MSDKRQSYVFTYDNELGFEEVGLLKSYLQSKYRSDIVEVDSTRTVAKDFDEYMPAVFYKADQFFHADVVKELTAFIEGYREGKKDGRKVMDLYEKMFIKESTVLYRKETK